MHVFLIYPYLSVSTFWMPLGLPFIAAELRKRGHTVAIFDRFAVQFKVGRHLEQVNQAMLGSIRDFRPDIVGLNTLSPLIHDAVECITLIRSNYKGTIVAGGYHATALPELTLRKIPGLNGIITGEGERVLARLADGEPPADLPGVWWRNEETIQPPVAPAAQIENLDSLCLPALDLMDMEFYTQRSNGVIRGHNLRAATLVTSRGCYRRCCFCAESLTYGPGVRFHSPAYVLKWIQHVVADYSVDGLHFHDNDFLANEARARDICQEMLKTGLHRRLKWSIQARAERLNRDIARLLKSAGCVLVEIGIEAGTQAELDRLSKGTTVEVNTSAVAVCRKAGLDVHAYMLTGMEDETIPDLEYRLAWVKRAKPTSYQWSQVAMHPGTALYREKGGDFFAKSEWTREAIDGYYSVYSLSTIPVEARREWMVRHFSPYARWHWWKDAFRRYPWRLLAPIIFFKLRAKVRARIRRLRRARSC